MRWWMGTGMAVGAAAVVVSLLGTDAAVVTPSLAHATDAAHFRAEDMDFAVVRDGQPLRVHLEFLLQGDATEGELAAVRAEYRRRFEAADGAVFAAGSYALNGYMWPAKSATWGYNSAGKPARLADELPVLRAAAQTWTDAGSAFGFSGGQATDAGTGACHGSTDGKNTVSWGPQPGTVIAVTCTWYTGNVAQEFDMEVDPEWDWTTSAAPSIDLQSVVTHEFGHGLGLAHSPERGTVMYATYTTGTLVRQLTGDDRAAIVSVYGPAPVTPAAAARGTSLALARGANLLTWPGGDLAAARAIAPLAGSVEVVYAFDAGTGTWLRYVPGAPAYVSNLPVLHAGVPYWIMAVSAVTLPVMP